MPIYSRRLTIFLPHPIAYILHTALRGKWRAQIDNSTCLCHCCCGLAVFIFPFQVLGERSMLNGKGMVNCSEGYFLKAVWLGIGDCVMGNDFFKFLED